MANGKNEVKQTEQANQQDVPNLEPDQLSEKEADEVVGGGSATYNIGTVQQS